MTKWIVEYTLGNGNEGRSIREYNAQDAEALADMWNGEKEDGLPIIRVEIVGLAGLEAEEARAAIRRKREHGPT